MKIGSLIKYYSLDNKVSYGIVTEYFKEHESLARGEPSVRVHWVEGDNITLETIGNLLDPKVDFIGVINEAW